MIFYFFRLFNHQQNFRYLPRGSTKTLAIRHSAIRVSLVFSRKGTASLSETFELTQSFASFGICLSPATVGNLRVWSAATFFTLKELGQPSAAVAQWIALVLGLLSFKSSKIFPLGVGVNARLFAVKEGVNFLRAVSRPGRGSVPRALLLLHLSFVFLRMCHLLLSSQLRLLAFFPCLPAWRLIYSAASEHVWPAFTPQEISACDTSFF